MSIARFRSFQGMPILFFTLQVSDGLPLLADESVHEILREAWLRSALHDGWLVGVYRILPDRVSLFASPVQTAVTDRAWLMAWQALTAGRINQVTQGTGRIWAECPPAILVASEDDYVALRAAMGAGASSMPVIDALAPAEGVGMIWQLIPSGEPAPTAYVPLGMT